MNTSNQSSVYSSVEILHITSTAANLVLGVPINSCVLWLVFTGPAGTTASDILPLNLSICELIFSLLFLLFFFIRDMTFYSFVSGFLYTGRPLFQSCICVERFVAVVHPVLFLKSKPLRYRVACCALAWLVVIGFSLVYVLFHVVIPVIATKCYFFMGQCLFFMSVMLWCSVAVLRALRRPMPGETGRERERDNGMKRRAFVIICLNLASFLVTYCIWCICVVYFDIRGLLVTDEWILVTCAWGNVTVLTGLVQPLLYLCQKSGKLTCVKPVQVA